MKTKKISILILFVCMYSIGVYAQGDRILQRRGKVEVSWRLVSDFQPAGATCWGWTYHIFISNANDYTITLKENEAYQNNGDNSSCWRSGAINLTGKVVPAGKWVEFTFRVTSSKNGQPGSPGLKYNIDWTSNYQERRID